MTHPTPPRTYPLAAPADDPRFSFGLIFDVAQLLLQAGYPALSGSDMAVLMTRLWTFLYRPEPYQSGDPERDPSTPPGGPLPEGVSGWPVRGGRPLMTPGQEHRSGGQS